MTSILKHIRIAVLLGWLVAWNALVLLGVYIDRNLGHTDNFAFHVTFGAAIVLTLCLCLGIIFVPSIQSAVLRENSRIDAVQRELRMVVLIGGMLAIAVLASLLFGGQRA